MTTAATNNMNENSEPHAINPKKFVLWLIIVASVMLFAAFTSAYIVRRGEGNWLVFDLPSVFAFTSAIIILGSISMQWALIAAKRDEFKQLKTALFLTLGFGFAFAAGQWIGWQQLVANHVHLVGNPSESFVFVISGLHLLHMLGAIGFVIVIISKTYQLKVHKKNMLSISLCTTFWHFLGAMWIYLYFFLLLNR